MGAIAGIFYPAMPKPVDPPRIRAMTDAQAHRGPDGAGVWTAQGIGLGHRRLATIDVGGSAQPMVDDAGEIAVVCDGTILNFAALRAELSAKGARFRTAGDAEVLVHGWRAWGPAMLDRLVGGFALAIHDARAHALFLARDRLGAKPLHYAELSDGALAFSSELKGLLAHPMLRRAPDLCAVEDYLAYGYVPDDACLVAGVRKLAAGHFLLVERGRGVGRARDYWDVDFSARAGGGLAEELVGRMREGVASASLADVPVGALLSGGAADAAVVALMAEASASAVPTCAIGFEGGAAPVQAGAVAQRFATAHRERTVAAGDALDALVRAFDEPFADPRALATWHLAALAREAVTVALSGAGFGAVLVRDARYRALGWQERVRAVLPAEWRRALFGRIGAAALAGEGDAAVARGACVLSREVRRGLWSDQGLRALGGHRAEDRYLAAMREAPARDAIDRAQYADLKIRLPGAVLTRGDRAGMAAGVELRTPLLDHRLVAFVASLPGSQRVSGTGGKALMDKALAPYLPREILAGRGAAVPPAGVAGALPMLAETGWFDMAAVARVAEARGGAARWQFAMLERSLVHLFG